ncbi:zonular occludens toxin domain-containing protein [Neisseria gonorrhoeae]|uniref:zonular occludens toxin domain-containing protein n=1 Tax=Neisseria gonorrhoeae TaxID=485 RepID=UPI0013F9E4BC|nr:zonular occludens toxin domain-containing protein [Neisseria gonorrhoeae]KAE9494019.1 zonular occludens toxin family protein [Neisseria gonorrhoeae]
MIYLFTGNMGAGKTPRVVLYDFEQRRRIVQNGMEDGTEADRPLYSAISTDWTNENSMHANWREGQIMSAPLRDVIPEGAVLIVGEAHYTYPVRAAGRRVPPIFRN